MTREEYLAEKYRLRQEYDGSIDELKIRYANANNPYKQGDIVEDHAHKIKIQKLKVYPTDPPQMIYTGVWLKKDGAPNKKGEVVNVFQSNLIDQTENV